MTGDLPAMELVIVAWQAQFTTQASVLVLLALSARSSLA
jgi:hypothetical protein